MGGGRDFFFMFFPHLWLSRSSRRLPLPTTQAVKRDVNLIQFPIGKAGCFSDQNFVWISSKFYNISDVLYKTLTSKDSKTSNNYNQRPLHFYFIFLWCREDGKAELLQEGILFGTQFPSLLILISKKAGFHKN